MNKTDAMTSAATTAATSDAPLFFLMLGPMGLLGTLYLLVWGGFKSSMHKDNPESEEYKSGRFMLLCAGPAFIISMAIIMILG